MKLRKMRKHMVALMCVWNMPSSILAMLVRLQTKHVNTL
jgi:hypothetical protein